MVCNMQYCLGSGHAMFGTLCMLSSIEFCAMFQIILFCTLEDSGKYIRKGWLVMQLTGDPCLYTNLANCWYLLVIGNSLGDGRHQVSCPWLLVDLVTHQQLSCERVF